ncbi:MAG: low affinity iron permease family protein [Bacteroidia bacterium]
MTKIAGNKVFEIFASKVSQFSGSTYAFLGACALVIIWAMLGPVFHYSENWQLIINTGTTIITFLMVFLIQKSQNKDSLAIQLKLNELVAANEFASNRMVSVEDMTEDELKTIKKYYDKLNEISLKRNNLQTTHSIDEAYKDSEFKKDLEEQISNIVDLDLKRKKRA